MVMVRPISRGSPSFWALNSDCVTRTAGVSGWLIGASRLGHAVWWWQGLAQVSPSSAMQSAHSPPSPLAPSHSAPAADTALPTAEGATSDAVPLSPAAASNAAEPTAQQPEAFAVSLTDEEKVRLAVRPAPEIRGGFFCDWTVACGLTDRSFPLSVLTWRGPSHLQPRKASLAGGGGGGGKKRGGMLRYYRERLRSCWAEKRSWLLPPQAPGGITSRHRLFSWHWFQNPL